MNEIRMPKTPKSDTICVTSYPPAWAELAEITCASHAAYCEAQSYDYDAEMADLRDSRIAPTYDQKGPVIGIRGFHKFNRILHFLPDYKWVVWLDADLVITNKDKPLPFTPYGITACYDWNGWNTTVFIVRSSPKTQAFFWACNNTGRDLFLYHPWHEMEAMRYFSSKPPYDQLVMNVSIKRLAAILPECYIPAGVPEPIMEPYAWEPGDFALHLSALPLERRIELAREYSNVATH